MSLFFFFSSRRRHTRFDCDWSSDVCSSDLIETIERDGVTMLRRPEDGWRPRDGFALTDIGSDLAGALDQANYCIWCHNQGKRSEERRVGKECRSRWSPYH